MTDEIIIIFVAVAGLLTANAVYYLALYAGQRRRSELRRRLQALGEPSTPSLLRERRISRIPALDAFLRPIGVARRLEKLLLQTDLTWTVASVLGMSVAMAIGLTILLMIALKGRNPALAFVGVPIGLLVPVLLVYNARIRRSQMLSTQLPDALDMMVRSLRAGHGISSGFKLVAEEMSPPVAVEFGRCFEEQNLGVEMREAVRHMTERAPDNLDLKIFAVSVIIQHETGGNLVAILEQISTTIRERFKFYGKLRALTAEGKMSGYILGALPFATGGFVAIFRPKYLAPLFTDPLGWYIAIGGLVMWGLGVLWMRKMVQVDY